MLGEKYRHENCGVVVVNALCVTYPDKEPCIVFSNIQTGVLYVQPEYVFLQYVSKIND